MQWQYWETLWTRTEEGSILKILNISIYFFVDVVVLLENFSISQTTTFFSGISLRSFYLFPYLTTNNYNNKKKNYFLITGKKFYFLFYAIFCKWFLFPSLILYGFIKFFSGHRVRIHEWVRIDDNHQHFLAFETGSKSGWRTNKITVRYVCNFFFFSKVILNHV